MDETHIGERLLTRAEELSRLVVALVWERVPGYEPPRIRREDLAAAVRPNVESVLRHLVAPAPAPPDVEQQRARDLGTARALQGVPLDVVVQSFRAAERVLDDAFVAEAGELSTEALRRGLQRLAEGFDRLGTWSIEAYRQTQDEITSQYDRAASDLLTGLVADDLSDAMVRRQGLALGLSVDGPCQGLALRTGDNPVVGATAARLQRDLLGLLGPGRTGRIVVGAARGATVFLVPGTVAPSTTQQFTALTQAYEDIRPRIGLGPAATDLVDGGRSCQRAVTALDVGDTPGVVHFDDVLLDILIRESSLVADRLRERLGDALVDAPHLVETVAAFFESDMSVRDTAAKLHVHVNTISYRLTRLREVTGLDPRSPRDLVSLRIAIQAISEAPLRAPAPPSRPPAGHSEH